MPGSRSAPHAFARRYAHAGMVRLGGEKMSKSLGNLVFVSRLLAGGTDPMAIRLAILAHHYRQDWDWSEEVLAAAMQRLDRWRAAAQMTRNGDAGAGQAIAQAAGTGAVLAGVRDRISDDLDAPGALAVVDRWAAAVTAADQPGAADSAAAAPGAAAPASVREIIDAVLGVRL